MRAIVFDEPGPEPVFRQGRLARRVITVGVGGPAQVAAHPARSLW